ncbi:hypothetical protein FJ875_26315 [Salmonella enterica]|nr:hypothetical protein [Salmonella enterica]EBO7769747.1 hypothetical protein [Salmonella enterica]
MANILFNLFMFALGVATATWWWMRKQEVLIAENNRLVDDMELMQKKLSDAKAVFDKGASMQREAASKEAVIADMLAKVQAVSEEAQKAKEESDRLLKEERIRCEGIVRQKHKIMVNAIAAAERRSRRADGIKRIHIDENGVTDLKRTRNR